MPITYPFPIKYSEVHAGLKLAYCDEGQGDKTLLFVHGLAGYIPLWKFQIDGLKTNHRCIAIDLPGNGMSPSGDFPYSMFFYAETIAKFIEKEKLQNVVICGHSMGGHVAIVLALRYPHLLQKMILIAPSGIEKFASHEVMGMQHFMNLGQYFISNSSQVESTIKQSFYNENNESNYIISDIKKLIEQHSPQKWNAMTTELIKAMLNEQVGQFLSSLNLPVLIIFGDKDEFIPNKLVHPMETTESIAKSGTKKIKGSKYELVKRAGHFVHIEKYEEVNNLIEVFVN